MYGHVGLDEIIWLLITCTFYFIVFFALGKTEWMALTNTTKISGKELSNEFDQYHLG